MEATLDHAQAALAAARGAGLAVERAEVARVASNVLVRLTGPHPPPFAARLTGATEGFRDPAANLRREARLVAAPAAHGGPFDAALLDACVDARVAQGAAYLAATGRGHPEALHRRLDWLRRGA